MGNSPIRIHTESDIGLLFMPKLEGGRNFPLRVMSPSYGIQPGGRVGWAGFPGLVKPKTVTAHPCYFEGVISTVIHKQNKLLYLVDGHGGPGVSGGPLWHWNEQESNYEIIGLCAQYLKGGLDAEGLTLPGLVVFESINPILGYLSTSNDLNINIIN